MRVFWFTVASVSIVASLLVSRADAAPPDPREVVTTLGAMVNAHDAEAALALFADDAVVTLLPPAAPNAQNVYRGKSEIRAWLELLRKQNFVVEQGEMTVTGDRVTSLDRFAEDGLRALGVAPLEGMAEVVVQEGKIVAFTNTVTPQSLARVQSAISRAEGTSPRLPRAGGPGSPVLSLLALGAVLALSGLMLRNHRNLA